MTGPASVADRYRAGESARTIASSIGVSRQRIYQILNGAGIRKMVLSTRARIVAGSVKTFAGYETECWLWSGSLSDGYGQISIAGKNRRVHCVAFDEFVGPIPTGLVIDHLCRNRACVNPDHLDPVTNRENVLRGDLADLAVRRDPITHCPHGHEYTSANEYLWGGKRQCRRCRTIRSSAGRRLPRASSSSRGGSPT